MSQNRIRIKFSCLPLDKCLDWYKLIEISRDICCRYVCRVLKCVGGITYAHRILKVTFWALKTRVIHFDCMLYQL